MDGRGGFIVVFGNSTDQMQHVCCKDGWSIFKATSAVTSAKRFADGGGTCVVLPWPTINFYYDEFILNFANGCVFACERYPAIASRSVTGVV